MLRGYRSIGFAALVAAIILAFGLGLYVSGLWPDQQPAQNSVQSQQSSPQNNTPDASPLNSIQKDWGCPIGKEERQSDLCAQWKAADAASNAAKYALWTLIMTALGTGLLVWTLAETRSNSRRELRAYVRYEPIEKSCKIVAGEPFLLPLNIVNYGHTPAIKSEFQHAVCIAQCDWQWSSDLTTSRRNNKHITIHKDNPSTVAIDSVVVLTADQVWAIKNGLCCIFARGTMFYADVFGGEHCSQISIEIGALEMEKGRIKIASRGNIAT